MDFTIAFSNASTKFIFLKGKTVDKEISLSRKKWSFNLNYEKSITSKEGKILISLEINLINFKSSTSR